MKQIFDLLILHNFIFETVYFASDFHLGTPAKLDSISREKQLIQWFGFK